MPSAADAETGGCQRKPGGSKRDQVSSDRGATSRDVRRRRSRNGQVLSQHRRRPLEDRELRTQPRDFAAHAPQLFAVWRAHGVDRSTPHKSFPASHLIRADAQFARYVCRAAARLEHLGDGVLLEFASELAASHELMNRRQHAPAHGAFALWG